MQPNNTICEACVPVIQSAVNMELPQSSEYIWYLNEPDSSGIYYNLVLPDSFWHHGSVISEAHYEVVKSFDFVIRQADIYHLSYVHDYDRLHAYVALVTV